MVSVMNHDDLGSHLEIDRPSHIQFDLPSWPLETKKWWCEVLHRKREYGTRRASVFDNQVQPDMPNTT